MRRKSFRITHDEIFLGTTVPRRTIIGDDPDPLSVPTNRGGVSPCRYFPNDSLPGSVDEPFRHQNNAVAVISIENLSLLGSALIAISGSLFIVAAIAANHRTRLVFISITWTGPRSVTTQNARQVLVASYCITVIRRRCRGMSW